MFSILAQNQRYQSKGRIPLPNRMNFWKSAKGGKGVIFNPKIVVADFGNFKQGFLIIKLQVISVFMICFFDNCIEKNQNMTHHEEGTSESPPPPPLELFRKFIRLCSMTLPLGKTSRLKQALSVDFKTS